MENTYKCILLLQNSIQLTSSLRLKIHSVRRHFEIIVLQRPLAMSLLQFSISYLIIHILFNVSLFPLNRLVEYTRSKVETCLRDWQQRKY